MNYGSNDIGNMRRDALRRTREMHRQSMSYPETQNSLFQELQPEKEHAEEKEYIKGNPEPPKQNKKNSGGLNSILPGFFNSVNIDSDKFIIIALILILAKDGADIKLLIALGYILM